MAHVGDAAQRPRVVARVHLGAEAGALAEAAVGRAVRRRRALAADALPRLCSCCCDAGRDQNHYAQRCGQAGEAHPYGVHQRPAAQAGLRVIELHPEVERGGWGW